MDRADSQRLPPVGFAIPGAETQEQNVQPREACGTKRLPAPERIPTESVKRRLVESASPSLDIDPATGQFRPDWKALVTDTFYVETDSDFNGLVELCLNEHPDTPVFLVRHPIDFDEHGLTQCVVLPENAAAASMTELDQDGLIYDPDSPSILLIDSRAMSAANLVGLNELLEKPPRYRGRPLSPKCKRVVLVNHEMHHEKGKKNSGKVRGDFWRRVSDPVNTWKAPEPTKTMDICQLDVATAEQLNNASACTLDFQNEPDWRKVLYGASTLDSLGQASYQHSALGQMATASQRSGEELIILKGAPWNNPDFVLALKQLLTRGSYRANGRCFDTSRLVFVRQDKDPGQISRLRDAVNWVSRPSSGMFCLNQGNFEECLGNTAIGSGSATYFDMLTDILRSSEGLHISSPLSQSQWVRLLKQIQATGLKTSIFIDEPNTQPQEFQASQPSAKYTLNSSVVRLHSAEHEQQYVDDLRTQLETEHQPVLTLSLTPDLELPAITCDLRVKSLKQRQFTLHETSLLKALAAGQPVIIRNLHKNPRLQQQLETLLQEPPSLIVNGCRRTFPEAKVHVVQPKDRQFKSPVWRALKRPSGNQSFDHPGLNHQSFDPSVVLARYQLPDTMKKQCQQLKQLLDVMQTISSSSRKLWPFPHPGYTPEVLDKVVREALRLKHQMKSDTLTQEHWRRAIEVVVLDDYRGHCEVHSFLLHLLDKHFSVASGSELARQWVDTAGLQQFLVAHEYRLDRDLVKAHFWALSRNLSLSCLPEADRCRLDEYPERHLDRLCAALAGACPDEYRAELVKKLGVEPSLPEGRRYRHLETLLRMSHDADRWHQHQGAVADSVDGDGSQVRAYTDDDYFDMARQLAAQLQAEEGMDAFLEVMPASLNGLSTQETDPVARVFNYLSRNITDWQSWQDCRYQTIADALQAHRLVFLKGEAGTGKSHSAVEVAKALNPHQKPVTVSVGPQSDQEKLFCTQASVPFIQLTPKLRDTLIGRGLEDDDWQVLQVFAEGTELSLTEKVRRDMQMVMAPGQYDRVKKILMPLCDTCTISVDGPILRWAKTQSVNDQPVVLIIDEANLAKPDLWDIFQGLSGNPPSINYGGEIIYLTDQHKVIMTGNLETAPGRKCSIGLRHQAVTLLLDPMPESFLEESILGGRLKDFQGLAAGQGEKVKAAVMTLWKHYQVLLNDHEFTPRDLNEVCDRLKISLESDPAEVSDYTLKQLVWQTMKDVLGGELPMDDTRLDSLHVWFFAQGDNGENDETTDTAYQLHDRDFDAFYATLRSGSDFTYQGKSTEALARHYWQILRKVDYETRNQCVMEGKHALLIQGPPGRGKDELFTRLHARFASQPGAAVDKQPLHLNASCSNWEEIRMAVREAASAGRIVVISELNRIASHFLEEDLNDLLTGQMAPGFCLIATVNPSDYAGREQFSPALSSRFVQQQIDEYSDTELQTIAFNALPANPVLAESIAKKHCRLRVLANRPDSSGIPPRTSDLLSVLTYIAQYPNLTPDQVDQLCASQYHPLLEMAGVQWSDLTPAADALPMDALPVDALPEGSSLSFQSVQPTESAEAGRKKILETLFRTFPGIGPVYITQETPEGYNPETGQLCLNLPFNAPDAVQRALLVMTKGHWIASQVPVSFPLSADSLPSALMILWQRAFAKQFLAQCGSSDDINAAIDAFFPLTSCQQKTLSMPDNAAIKTYVDERLEEQGYQPSPVLFRELLKALSAPDTTDRRRSDGLTPLPMELSGAEAQTLAPEGAGLVTRVQGNLVAQGIGKDVTVHTVFKDQKSGLHRLGVEMFSVGTDGNILSEANPMGTQGYNVVEPLPLNEQVVLKAYQVQGVQKVCLGDGQSHVLTGLMAYPQTRLTHLSVTPECAVEVFQDRCTGLYMIRGAKSDCREPYSVEFVLDPEPSIFDPESQGLVRTDCSPCHPMIRKVIDQHPDPEFSRFRDRLSKAVTTKEELMLIENFCRSMRGRDALHDLEGERLCTEILGTKPGYPRQRQLAFWMLASWCGIPVRVGTPLSGTGSVEVSENGGFTWKPVFIGGEADNPNKAEDKSPEFPERKKDRPPSVDELTYDLDDASPESVARLLTTIKRDQPIHRLLVSMIPRVLPNVISQDGPVSVELVKQWLEDICSGGTHNKGLILADLLEHLHKKAQATNSEELMAITNSLSYFIIFEKKWVPEAYLTNPLHRLFVQKAGSVILRGTNQQMHRYYSKVLTQELVPGRDILCTSNSEELKDDDFDPAANSAIGALLQGATSARLHQLLLGELPGVHYKRIPPGSIKAERLVQQLPAFKCSQPQPALRQALVTVPTDLRPIIEKYINNSILDPDARKPNRRELELSKSKIIADFLSVYAEYAFLQHLYQLGAGESGSLRVLYPSEKGRLRMTPLDSPYSPVKAGWIKPRDFNEFYQMANASDTGRVPCDSRLLRESWAASGFNEADLCLLEKDALQQGLKSWMESIDWVSLLPDIEALPAWRSFLKTELREEQEEYKDEESGYSCLLPALTQVDDTRKPASGH